MELKRITLTSGRKQIWEHFHAYKVPGRVEMRHWVENNLEGVDVYFEGMPHDGVLDSKTCFGKVRRRHTTVSAR